MHGAMKIGLNFLIFSVHPMKPHNTLMSSFLFNVALMNLTALPVVHFCSQARLSPSMYGMSSSRAFVDASASTSTQAFSVYAQNTTIQQVFSTDIDHIKGFSWLFTNNFFIYLLLSLIGIAALFTAIRGPEPYKSPRRRQKEYEV